MSRSSTHFAHRSLKVLLLGDSNVGKTAIISQFVDREFSSSYQPTIGSDYVCRNVEVGGKFVTLQLWDTAGQERYRALASSFFRGTELCVFVYDVTSEESFENIDFWHRSFDAHSAPLAPGFPYLLLGNKTDENAKRKVPKERAEEMAQERGFMFWEVSAKLCENLTDAFEEGVKRALESGNASEERPSDAGQLAELEGETEAKSGCQC
jgi:Ras-related protein Rab-7A